MTLTESRKDDTRRELEVARRVLMLGLLLLTTSLTHTVVFSCEAMLQGYASAMDLLISVVLPSVQRVAAAQAEARASMTEVRKVMVVIFAVPFYNLFKFKYY